MEILTAVVILVSALAMVFIFTVAGALERRTKGLPVWAGYDWRRTLAYVAILFGVVVGLVQIYKAGKLTVFLDVLPTLGGISFIVALGLGAFSRR